MYFHKCEKMNTIIVIVCKEWSNCGSSRSEFHINFRYLWGEKGFEMKSSRATCAMLKLKVSGPWFSMV